MKQNTIYLGNCLDLIDLLDQTPQLIIMSPPDVNETNYSIGDYEIFLYNIYNMCMRKLDQDGVLISITTDTKKKGIYTKHMSIISSLDKYQLFNYKIWQKSEKANLFILQYAHILFFRKYKSKITNNKIKEFYQDVFNIPVDKIKGYKNKDSFPSELIEILIKNFTNELDLIFDPFIGTGKTALVAQQLNRNYIGFELDEKNYELANYRMNIS